MEGRPSTGLREGGDDDAAWTDSGVLGCTPVLAGYRSVQTIVQPAEAETLPRVSEDGNGEALYGDGEAVSFEGGRGLGVNGYIPVVGERAEEVSSNLPEVWSCVTLRLLV